MGYNVPKYQELNLFLHLVAMLFRSSGTQVTGTVPRVRGYNRCIISIVLYRTPLLPRVSKTTRFFYWQLDGWTGKILFKYCHCFWAAGNVRGKEGRAVMGVKRKKKCNRKGGYWLWWMGRMDEWRIGSVQWMRKETLAIMFHAECLGYGGER